MFLFYYNGVIVYTGKMENYTKKTTKTKTKQINKQRQKPKNKKKENDIM